MSQNDQVRRDSDTFILALLAYRVAHEELHVSGKLKPLWRSMLSGRGPRTTPQK